MPDPLSWDDLLRICPYRALVCEAGAIPLPADVPLDPLRLFDTDGGTLAFFGYGLAEFDPEHRREILDRLRGGDTLLLVAMAPAVLDSALNILALDLLPPVGSA